MPTAEMSARIFRHTGYWIFFLVLIVAAALVTINAATFAQVSPGCGADDKNCYVVKKVIAVPKVATVQPVNPKTAQAMLPSQTMINPQAHAPPALPQTVIYSGPSIAAQSATNPTEEGAPAEISPGDSAAAHLSVSRLGLEKTRDLIRNLSAAVLDGCQIDGRGGPCGDIDPGIARQAQTEFFTGTFSRQVTGDARRVTRSETESTLATYDNIPGGVVLEGAANFSDVSSVAYDANFNALTINNILVFYMRTPPEDVSALADAIADDERIGVSLDETYLVYGELDRQSGVAINLQLADGFLGDIAFARNEWSRGYNLAQGYTPRQDDDVDREVAVFFKLSGLELDVIDNQIRVASSVFSARIVPLREAVDGEVGLQPDNEAIDRGEVSAAYSANAEHITDNIDYYREERVITQVFDYGAVAAVLRGLKAQGFDLHSLARSIESTWSE
jgi:hypothetical protein